MLAQIPKLERMPRIEQRAECIADPVERLRYLRLMASPERKPWHRALRYVAWTILGAALLLTPVLAPGSRPKSTTRPDRELPDSSPLSKASGLPASTSLTTNDPAVQTAPQRVWRVERSGSSELYSNGLRIDLSFQVSNRPRAHYSIFSLTGAHPATKTGFTPVGIVYHTTESLIAPFEEDQNRRLKQLGRNVLELIRREHAYHYMIDRFGRVFAAVAESDAANHAGNSVWADAHGIYVNLNDSFLGVAFEAQTESTQAVTPAQVASAKALTEMLRFRYGIPAGNCVTHAQVSVNPDNMRIGSHTDWASDFPFAALGLPDNYSTPLASLTAFGFEYDSIFLGVMGQRWRGLDLADEQMETQAAREAVTVPRYRAILEHRYKEIASALKEAKTGEAAK